MCYVARLTKNLVWGQEGANMDVPHSQTTCLLAWFGNKTRRHPGEWCCADLCFGAQSLGEGSILETHHTDGFQFDHTLGFGYQVKDGAEGLWMCVCMSV